MTSKEFEEKLSKKISNFSQGFALTVLLEETNVSIEDLIRIIIDLGDKKMNKKNKILIGAGILLTVLILGLIIICGASTPSGTPTKETYEVRVDSVQVEIEGEGARNIPLSILTDNIQFNAEIENKEYTDIKIINKQN